jgi:hypothetical protein
MEIGYCTKKHCEKAERDFERELRQVDEFRHLESKLVFLDGMEKGIRKCQMKIEGVVIVFGRRRLNEYLYNCLDKIYEKRAIVLRMGA